MCVSPLYYVAGGLAPEPYSPVCVCVCVRPPCTRWLEGWIQNKMDVDLRGLEAAFGSKKAELDATRRQLMAQAIDQQLGAGVQALRL